MKNSILFAALALFLGVVPHVLAQGFVPLAPIPGLTQGVTTNPAGLATFFNNLYKYSIGLAAALAVIQIIWAGLDIAIFQKDSVSAITDSKGKIYNAVFGLVLVLSPVLVFSIINPSILNLSLNLPPLKTTSGTPITSGQTTTPVTLSNTAVQDRQEAGGVTILNTPAPFAITSQISPLEKAKIIMQKQSECTNAAGGPGLISPIRDSSANFRYVCQTCPSGTTPRISTNYRDPSQPTGSCIKP